MSSLGEFFKVKNSYIGICFSAAYKILRESSWFTLDSFFVLRLFTKTIFLINLFVLLAPVKTQKIFMKLR